MHRITQTYIPSCREGTMLVPAQQSLRKSCNEAAGNNKEKVGPAVETKARASDQRIELETRKQRESWLTVKQPPCGIQNTI